MSPGHAHLITTLTFLTILSGFDFAVEEIVSVQNGFDKGNPVIALGFIFNLHHVKYI